MKHAKLSTLVKRLPAEIQKKFDTMSFEAVDEAAHRFVHSVGLRFKAGDWLNELMPPRELLEGDVTKFEFFEHVHSTSHFVPFVEKALVPQGSRLCIIGDVHGDIAYLIDVLGELQRQGVLDEEYRLIDPTVHIVFLGDYTNRNAHGVEVMLVLFYLYRHNMGRVFLLRGNHEYAISTRVMYDQYQQFYSENNREVVHKHDVPSKDSLIAEMSHKFSLYNFPNLLYWFDFLPLAAYIGCYDEQARQIDYISLCHGGIEPGYNATHFLSSQARFERLVQLDRSKALRELISNNNIPNATQTFEVLFKRLQDIGMHAFVDSYIEDKAVDLMKNHSPLKLRIGMQFNSFLTDNNDAIACASSQRHRNLLFGRELTRYFLEQGDTAGHRVISIIRGHQHLDEHDPVVGLDSPMLTQLRQRQGIVRQWDGMLYTMGDGGSATGWQAFLIVTTGKSLQEWTATHYFRADTELPFETKETLFIG